MRCGVLPACTGPAGISGESMEVVDVAVGFL